ncbi:MAG: hypothetical protein ACFN1F_02530, partial [Segatella sp.]
CKSPPRKFPSCTLQETVFQSTLIGGSHPLFIHLQGKGIPVHVAYPVTASYPSRILTLKAWLLDADCNVI